jgi:cytochrome d ubiquinol oxidase subunit I
MKFDVQTLSRIQFALTIMFHYLFPPLSIGLGALMVIMEGLYLRTKDKQYEAIARFWTRIFAVNFAMGVATGIVMEFQFGTNWSAYSRYVGDVFGSALASEGIFAFFLESGFLSILVFGWDRVSSKMHFFATCMVALGALFSSVWIIIANSWQQTPAGHHIVQIGTAADGSPLYRAEIVNFWAMVFNPSAMPRLGHVVAGAFILGAFFIMSISAFYILKGRHLEISKKMFTVALVFGFLATMAAPAMGHLQAHVVHQYQPAKLAAFEGNFKTTEGGTPIYIFGVPDPETETVKYGVYVPGGLSFLVHGNFTEPVEGLDKVAPNKEDRPPVVLPFITYHIMVGIGSGLIGLLALALFLRWRGKLFDNKLLMMVFVVAVVGPYIANQAGWVSCEVGRQPWVVYKLLRTTDAVSKSVQADQVLASILMFGLIYALLFAVWVYVLNDKIQHGPEEPEVLEPANLGLSAMAAEMSTEKKSMTMILRKPKPPEPPAKT